MESELWRLNILVALHLHCNKKYEKIWFLMIVNPFMGSCCKHLHTCGSNKYQGYFGSSQITLNTTTSSNRGNIKPLPADRCSDRECWGLCKKQHVTSLSSHMNWTLWEGTFITDMDTVAQMNIEQWKSRHSNILSFDPYKSRNGAKCWYRREEVNSDNAATQQFWVKHFNTANTGNGRWRDFHNPYFKIL